MTTVYAIRDFLRDYAPLFYNNYINGCLVSGYTNDMFETTKAMIDEGKPMIITSAYWFGAHFWVMDGYKYHKGELVLHCNWGWGGDYDGYFSKDCFNPTQSVEYDKKDQGYAITADNTFSVLTYTISYDLY